MLDGQGSMVAQGARLVLVSCHDNGFSETAQCAGGGVGAAAARRRVSQATRARELLSVSLARARPVPSAYEVMQAACGVVTDAPRDLATSKRHLADYGRD